MRNLIVSRLTEMSVHSDGFSYHTTNRFNKDVKWREVHVSKVDFTKLTDEELFEFYNLIFLRCVIVL
jgi:hypothetical protein